MTYQLTPAGAPLAPFLPPRHGKQAQPQQTPLIKSQSKLFLTKATKDYVINKDTWWILFLMGRGGAWSRKVVPAAVPVACYYPKEYFPEVSYLVKVGTSSAYTKDSIFIMSLQGWKDFSGCLCIQAEVTKCHSLGGFNNGNVLLTVLKARADSGSGESVLPASQVAVFFLSPHMVKEESSPGALL